MFECIVVALLLLALVVLAARKGHRHLIVPGLPWGIIGAGALSGYLLESLPFTRFRAEPSVQTLLAIVCGVLGGRMIARGLAGWGRAWEQDLAKGHPPKPGIRLVHPFIAAGIWIAALPALYAMTAARHETLEILGTPRHPETHVVRGAEDVSLDGTNGHAVLLVHGFLGSPADFGDLPAALHAKGYTVRAPRLPGHGRFPGDVAAFVAKDYDDAVDAARAELAKTHGKVSLVGMSFGAALAVRSAAKAPAHHVVLVNPYLGATAEQSWLPVSPDTLLDVASKMFRRVFRPAALTRVNDPEGLARQRAYYTVSMPAAVEARRIAQEAAALGPPAGAATLLLSTGDRTVPSDAALAWFGAAASRPGSGVAKFERSDHLLLLDYDRAAATATIVEALSR